MWGASIRGIDCRVYVKYLYIPAVVTKPPNDHKKEKEYSPPTRHSCISHMNVSADDLAFLTVSNLGVDPGLDGAGLVHGDKWVTITGVGEMSPLPHKTL